MGGLGLWFVESRRRTLLILGALTLAFVVLAVLAVAQRAREVAPKFTPVQLFPGLSAKLDHLAEIDLTDLRGTFHVKLMPGKGWVIVEKNDFPAAFSEVRSTAVGMAGLELTQPKTTNPKLFHTVYLGDPAKKGSGIEVTLINDKGQKMAQAIFGKQVETTDALGRSGIFVRRPGEDRAWLARGYVTASSAMSDWFDKNIVTLMRDDIRDTHVEPPKGPAYTVSRATKDQMDFTLDDMPKGRDLAYASIPDGVGTSLIGFTFDDVKPIQQVDFSKASELTTDTFGGLTLRLRLVKDGDQYWAALNAEATSAEAQQQAAMINARADNWAFNVPSYKGQLFETTRDSLLKAPNSKDTDAQQRRRFP